MTTKTRLLHCNLKRFNTGSYLIESGWSCCELTEKSELCTLACPAEGHLLLNEGHEPAAH